MAPSGRSTGDRLGWNVWCHCHGGPAAATQGPQGRARPLRYLNPMPRNIGDVLKRYKKVLVPELNAGQLRMLLRSEFLVDAVGLNKVQGTAVPRERDRGQD